MIDGGHSALPPPLRGRAGEGGSPGRRSLWIINLGRRRLWLTPLPALLRSADLPLKGGGGSEHVRVASVLSPARKP
jgi:hypothetical protein